MVDAVESALDDEDVPSRVKEQILECVYDILRDEIGEDDEC